MMARHSFSEATVDFGKMETELGKLEAPVLTLRQILDRLDPKLREMQARGVTTEQMREVLKENGVDIGEQRFRAYIKTGKLPDSKVKRRVPEVDGGSASGESGG